MSRTPAKGYREGLKKSKMATQEQRYSPSEEEGRKKASKVFKQRRTSGESHLEKGK